MKKALSLLMVAALCLALLSACSTSTPSNSASAPPASSPASSPAPSPEASPSAPAPSAAAPSPSDSAPASSPAAPAPGGATESLKIGVIANLTGWFASVDTNNVYAVNALAKIYNDQGGIKIGDKTYMIDIDTQDGQSDATGIRNASQILVNDGCKFVVGPNDFFMEGALDIFEKAGVMNVMSMNNMDFNAINPDLKFSYCFNNGSAAQMGSAVQSLIKNYPNVKTVVYATNDDGVNDQEIAVLKTACDKYGLTYVDKPVIYDPNTTDFSAIALQVVSSGADAFIGNYTPDTAGGMLKEVRNSGSNMVFACIMGINAGVLIPSAGAANATNAFTLGPDLTQENNTDMFYQILSVVREQYGDDAATAFTPNDGNSIYVILQLMQGAKSIDVADVQAYWNTISTIDTIWGTAKPGGLQIYGVNHLLACPDPVTMLQDGNVVFGGWFETEIP